MSEALRELLERPPFGLDAADKEALYLRELARLTRAHRERCPEYARILDLAGLGEPEKPWASIRDIPFIPVRLFKEYALRSVPREEVVKELTSSGTTGQQVSRIFLDRATASMQTRVLVKIVTDFTGAPRLPFLVVDVPSLLTDRRAFSARAAGVLGFSLLGSGLTYLLNEDATINFAALDEFLERWRGRDVLVFGFTFVVWRDLCQQLERLGRTLPLRGILVHGGGWKKLSSLAVDNGRFKEEVRARTGLQTVANYYGMVEQTGSIFMECGQGHLHASSFSEVLIRHPLTHEALPPGQPGLVQLLSLLPESYPGHSILTEDLGEILGLDGCPCGRKGTFFRIIGRMKDAETRGCSDAVAA